MSEEADWTDGDHSSTSIIENEYSEEDTAANTTCPSMVPAASLCHRSEPIRKRVFPQKPTMRDTSVDEQLTFRTTMPPSSTPRYADVKDARALRIPIIVDREALSQGI